MTIFETTNFIWGERQIFGRARALQCPPLATPLIQITNKNRLISYDQFSSTDHTKTSRPL